MAFVIIIQACVVIELPNGTQVQIPHFKEIVDTYYRERICMCLITAVVMFHIGITT